jgi:hypothetical protein
MKPKTISFTPRLLGTTFSVGRAGLAMITDEDKCTVQIEEEGRAPRRMSKAIFYERIGKRSGELHLFSRAS